MKRKKGIKIRNKQQTKLDVNKQIKGGGKEERNEESKRNRK
jgi:hypothetical protein